MESPPRTAVPVTETPAAPSDEAEGHFARLLGVETDCWDVHASLAAVGEGRDSEEAAGFVVLDVRSPEAYAAGHVPGSVNLPHRRIEPDALAAHGPDTLFVVYCNGPHCNGADKAALRLARLGRPVKKMIGGVTGWRDEGFDLVG